MTEIVHHLEAEAEKLTNPTGLRRRRPTNPYQRARSQKRTDKSALRQAAKTGGERVPTVLTGTKVVLCLGMCRPKSAVWV